MKRILHVSIFIFLLAFSSKAQNLDSPVLTEPPDVDIVVSPTVTLEWDNVNYATAYEVQISLDNNFTSLVNSTPVILTVNYYQIPAGVLNNFTNYYWRVRARNNNVVGNFSAVWSFRTSGTAPQEITSLVEVVQNFNLMNNMNPGQIHILLQKLNSALNYYIQERIFLANLNLQLFKLRVYILMFSNFMTYSDGQSLIYNANKILVLINGDNPSPEEITLPNKFELKQNYPNPFNPSTAIEYTIPENSKVSLKVYDVLGRETATLVDKEQNSGTYLVIWNAKSASSGIYFYRITAGNYSDTKRMVLNK
jgi:hypothetical protein